MVKLSICSGVSNSASSSCSPVPSRSRNAPFRLLRKGLHLTRFQKAWLP